MKAALKYIFILVILALIAAGAAYFALREERGIVNVSEIERAPSFSGIVRSVADDSITVEGTAVASSDVEPKTEVRKFELNTETEVFIRKPEKGQFIAQYERPASRASLKVGGWVVIYTQAVFQENTGSLRLPSGEGIKIIVDRVSIFQ